MAWAGRAQWTPLGAAGAGHGARKSCTPSRDSNAGQAVGPGVLEDCLVYSSFQHRALTDACVEETAPLQGKSHSAQAADV